MDPRKRRGYPLRRWLRLDQRAGVRSEAEVDDHRRDVRHSDEHHDVDIVRAIWDVDYDIDAVQRSYAAWGCSPPSPPSQRRD